MKIANYAVRNYQFTLVIFIMIIVLGLTTLLHISRSEDPEMHPPSFTIVAVYPGASPKDMEDLLVKPLEKEIYSLENIVRIRTTIKDGVASLGIEYKYSSNVESKYQEIVRVVNEVKGQLPAEVQKIEVLKWQPSDVNILQIALVSENASRDKLNYYAKMLQEELERLPALKNVHLSGLPEREVRIEADLEKMAQMNIPVMSVISNLQSNNTSIPGGTIDAGAKTYNIKTSGTFRSIDEIGNTIAYSANGTNIRLKDIAKVYYGYADEKYLTRINGHRCVFVVAAQKDGENITHTKKLYEPIIGKFRKMLPANIDLVKNFDQADNVNKRLAGLGKDFLIAILLVAVTLLPLGRRPAIIVMISIPLALSIGIVLLQIFGFNLNQLSIVGLVVALGLLVDDSIVVVENIERWMHEGHSRMDATLKATSQIGKAVLACTVTLVIAFMPLVFMPEGAGDFIRGLPVAVIFCVVASLFVSVTIIPFLSSRLLKDHAGNPEGNILMQKLKSVIHHSYAPILDKAIRRPFMTLAIAVSVFIGAIVLIKLVGFGLFPASEKPQFLVNITSPSQASISYTDSVARKIEAELVKEPLVKYFATHTGKGNPRIYYNELQETERSNFAQIFVQLDENTRPDAKIALIEKLRNKWTPYPGAKVVVKNFEQGPMQAAPIEVRLFGDDLDSLRVLAARVETILRNTPGTIYVDNPVSTLNSDIRVRINREKAQALGVPIGNIDRTVRLAVAGLDIGHYNDDNGNEYNLLFTRAKEGKPTLEALNNLMLNSYSGKTVALSQIAELKFESSPLTINHQEKRRVVSVKAFVRKGALTDRVVNDVISRMDKFEFPVGYSYEMGGEVESRHHSFGGFGSIIVITVFLFIAVLILVFRTFKSTLIVLSVIPLGIVGAAVALWLTGNPLSFVTIIGLIALAGIEVKNTILLVDFTNQLRSKGMKLDAAIKEAGELRFLPIVLTTLTAIGGLIPIAISTNPLISPLAIVLIGGLISSTLLSRIVTPVIYKLIPPEVEIENT